MRLGPLMVLGACFALPSAVWADTPAKQWQFQSGTPKQKAGDYLRLMARTGLWVSEFTRTNRACLFQNGGGLAFPGRGGGGGPVVAGLEPADAGTFCPLEDSSEVGASVGGEISFRISRPFHVTWGMNLIYSTPEYGLLKNQMILSMPFGAMVTWPEWELRPIAQATITPMLFITDLNKDYTLGGHLGPAYRLFDKLEVSVLVGYETSDSARPWQGHLGFHPIP